LRAEVAETLVLLAALLAVLVDVLVGCRVTTGADADADAEPLEDVDVEWLSVETLTKVGVPAGGAEE
jgi:hypothetical protein